MNKTRSTENNSSGTESEKTKKQLGKNRKLSTENSYYTCHTQRRYKQKENHQDY